MNNKDFKKYIYGQSRTLTPNEIEFGYEHKDQITDTKLNRLLNNIINSKPDTSYYAMAWLKAIVNGPKLSEDDIINSISLFNKNLNLIDKLKNRLNHDVLIAQIYRLKFFFEPLILIENQKFTDLDKKYSVCIQDPFSLNVELLKLIGLYKNHVEQHKLTNLLSKYQAEFQFDDSGNITNIVEISRAQLAITVMFLSELTDYDLIIGLNKSIRIMSGLQSRKLTKTITHILCCIVYRLLQIHAKNPVQKQNGRCRELTAEIVNFISPKDDDENPYSPVNRRGVEVALTRK